MPVFKPSLLTIALVAAGIAPSAYAAEQNKSQQKTNEVEVIQVTGIRGSLQKSQALKMDSSSIVEAISAEDIGKLPDVSIAESLARLPGLTSQRVNGRGQVISIRGLDPDFSTALLNGRQQVSTGDNRSVEFDQYPSELLSGAVIYKTPDASLLGQGLAGTVDMQTIRPLHHGERTFVINTRYEWNGMEALNNDADDTGERLTLSYIDQFADDTLGVAIGYAHINTPTQGKRYEAWGYPTLDGLGPLEIDDDAAVIGGVKPFVQSNTLERDSVMAVIEYAPGDKFTSTLDMFYSEFEETQLLRGIELPLGWGAWGPNGGTRLAPGYTVENGLVTSGTFTNVGGVIRSDLEKRDAELYAIGWNNKYEISDTWTVEADISYSKADRVDQIIENYSGYVDGFDDVTFKTSGTGTVFGSSLDYTDASKIKVTNVQGWGSNFVPGEDGGQKGYYKRPASTDELTQLRLSAEHLLDSEIFSSIEFGINYDEREKTKTTEPEYYFGLPGDTPEERSQADLPANTTTTDLSFIGIDGIIGYDPLAMFNSGTYDLVRAIRADVNAKSWTVEEEILTAYVQANIDAEWGSIPVKGNIGLQVIDSEQSSHAFSSQGEGVEMETVPQAGGKSYTEVLPSLNLSFEVGDQQFVRVGAARTLARPRMDDLRASSTFTLSTNSALLASTDVNLSPWSAGGGNPELDPWIADAYDLTYEMYLDDSMGYFSVAGFYKDLKSYIVDTVQLMDFSGFPIPEGMNPQLTQGYLEIKENGQGGNIKGLEVSGSVAGELFHESLTGYGTIFSASYTDSDIEPENTPARQLPGMSKNVYSLTFYYENEGLSARVSGRYRSNFIGELPNFDAARTQRIVSGETLVDAQISYSFDEGTFDGLTLLLQGNNLTDEPFVSYANDSTTLITDYQSYGRTFAVGLSYKL